MHVSSNLRVVIAVTLLTFLICFIGLRAERGLIKPSAASPAAETDLSVDASGSLTASHSQ